MRFRTKRQLFVHQWQQSNGRPVLLLHGLGASHRVWRGTVARLGGRYQFLAPDLPGYGRTPLGRTRLEGGSIPLEDNANLVAAWLNRNQIESLPVVGHSMGGLVAVDLARRFPDLVERLILVAPAGLHRPEWEQALRSLPPWKWYRRFFLWLMSTNWLGPRFFSGTVHDWHAISEQDRSDLRWGWRRSRALERVRSYYQVDFTMWIEKVKQPVALIWGMEDRVVPVADAAVLQEIRPDARLALIENCGHLPMLEQPEYFSQLLMEELALSFEGRVET